MQATKPGAVVRRGGQWVPAGEQTMSDRPVDSVEEPNGDGKPWKTATRAEWDEYARTQGLDPAEYGSKDALIEALG